jgi:hypothetical protein
MAFNTKVIKKSKKSKDIEEMSPEEKYGTSGNIKTYSADIPEAMKVKYGDLAGASKISPESFGTIKKVSEYNKPMKGADSLKLDAMIAAAAKKKLPVKASMEKEVEISPMEKEKKPTEFVQHGGSMLQYLKKKK